MDTSERQPFGEVLKQFRERMQPKMSQDKLAQALGMNRRTIVAWELGNNNPSNRSFVLEIAKHLRLSNEETDTLLAAALFPITLWYVPHHRNPFFTGREELLQHLRHTLVPDTTAALTPPQAISGLGGIGKTQTAVEFAYRYRQDYQAVFWLHADSREILFAQLAQLTQILKLPERNEQDQTRAIHAVRHWLKGHNKWLLILDNIEDLLLVEELLPSGHCGCALLTTRAHVTEPIAYANELRAMTEQESVLFLLRRTKVLRRDMSLDAALEDDRVTAKKIWEFMDGLPLALDQAGAYILGTGCGLSRYLDLLQRRRTELLRQRGGYPSGHPESVTATLFLAFEKIAAKNRAAADLLRFCAFVHPEAIPEELLTEGGDAFSSALQAVANDPIKLDKAIEALRKYSLVHRDHRAKTLTVHTLVQAVLRDEMDENTPGKLDERAVRAVYQALLSIINRPLPPPNMLLKAKWIERQRYLPHMRACASLIERWDMQFIEATRLLHATADYIQFNLEKEEEAEPLYRKALAMWERIPGAEDDVANCLNSLAIHYLTRGKYEEAEPMCQRALVIYERLQGPESPDVVNMLELYAMLLQLQIVLLSHTHREGELSILRARIQKIRSQVSI